MILSTHPGFVPLRSLRLIWLLCAMISSPGYANDAGAYIEALRPLLPPPGQFARIPGSKIDVLTRKGEYPHCTGLLGIECHKSWVAFFAWTGMAFNRIDGILAFPAGGGHADYGGNEFYAYDIGRNRWSRDWEPRPLTKPQPHPKSGKLRNCTPPEAGPTSSHTYDSPVYVPPRDANGNALSGDKGEYFHYVTGGFQSKACRKRKGGWVPFPRYWTFNRGSGEWTARSTPRGQLNLQYPRGDYHDARDRIYIVATGKGGPMVEINPRDGYAVKTIAKLGWVSAGGVAAVMDQDRHIFWYYGKSSGLRGIRFDPETGKRSGIKVPKSLRKDLGITSLAVEPTTGNLVAWFGDHRILHIDVKTGKTTRADARTGYRPPKGKYKNRVYGKWYNVPGLPGTFIGVNDPRQGVVLYRLPVVLLN